jgi:hypothetical protein
MCITVISKVTPSNWHCVVYSFKQATKSKYVTITEATDSKLINRLQPRHNHTLHAVRVKNSHFIHTLYLCVSYGSHIKQQ